MKRIIGALIALSAIVDCAYSAPVVTLTGEYSGPVYTQAPVVENANTGQANLDVNNDSLDFQYQGNRILGTADTSGHFGLSADVYWRGSSTVSYSYSDTISNLGSVANDYSFSFYVPELSLGGHGSDWTGASVTTASYNYQILVNGASVFHSSATYWAADNGNTNNNLSSDLFGLDQPYYGTANLGVLSPGQSLDLSVLVTLTAARMPSIECDQAISDCSGIASAYLGDPSDITSQPLGFNVTSVQVATVPLPQTAVLFVSGLLGLGFARRKSSKPAFAA